jgi:hypothetical protein
VILQPLSLLQAEIHLEPTGDVSCRWMQCRLLQTFQGCRWGLEMKHMSDIERIAMVREMRLQHGMAIFCKPFIKAEIRYFDHAAADARIWLGED